MVTSPRFFLAVSLVLGLATHAPAAQGVVLKNKAVVLFGESSNCSKPATIDVEKVAAKTPEYKEIQNQGLSEDSARYKLLMSAMLKRIKEACKAVAEDQGHDLVVREGDISNAKGLTQSDLTTKVVDYVEKNSK
jgi:Skp family chaperone for outer membrane proteins